MRWQPSSVHCAGLVPAPSLCDATFEKRGFPVAGTPAAHRLEAIPQAAICGFEWGIETRGRWELERRLSLTTPDLRGFAYEDATMAYTVLDVMPVAAQCPSPFCRVGDESLTRARTPYQPESRIEVGSPA